MKRLILVPLVALFALLALAVAPAAAQYVGPPQAPRYAPGYQTPLSPYLRMLVPGDPGVNYFSLVQPEFQRREDRNQIFGSIQGIANQLPTRPGITDRDIDTPLRSSGHATAFGYTGSYFGGLNQMGRSPANPFGARQGNRNPAQPAGSKPIKPR